MTKIRVLDLFSGIGGFSLGLERTGGFETVAFCEIEEFPRKVLAKHWPGVPIYEDVKKLRGEDVGPVDVICGGFPCQDVSIAAHVHGRGGIGGKRSGLYGHVLRLADELGKPALILENVRALLGDGFVTVLQDLCTLGYDAEWHCIPACAVGAPQSRDRIWIIAYPSGQRVEGFFAGRGLGETRQGWPCRPEDLQQVYSDPFDGSRWPQPLIRGSDNRPPDWAHRIKAIGNAVVPQVVEMFGLAILEAQNEN
tara:strand:- start:980 stop:1735 length:756 start_codon:yes stop_codon:yes gene_type:complete